MDNTKENKTKKFGSIIKTVFKFIIALIIFNLIFTAFLIGRNVSWKDGFSDNLRIYYSNIMRECMVSTVEWDGNTENTVFTIPDEYEGIKVTSLGGVPGLAPTEFTIRVPEDMHPEAMGVTEDENCISDVDEDTVTYCFTVKLGKNIKKLEHFAYKEYYTDDSGKVIYIVETNYECPSENKWIYSEDGKLYDKNTNELLQ